MGDHRASVKIEFEMHGHKEKSDFWINWSPRGSWPGCDHRIIEFFEDNAAIAVERYEEESGIADQRRKAEDERLEIERLIELKKKYPDI